MSRVDVTSPLPVNQARKLVALIIREGTVFWASHARDEMAKDNLTELDAMSVLRCGRIYEPPEQIKGSWRYRMHTDSIGVVVAFRSESALVVVTAWRKR